MHRATDAGLYIKPPCLSITIVTIEPWHCTPPAMAHFAIATFGAPAGAIPGGRRRRHTMACACRPECWQCCQSTPSLTRSSQALAWRRFHQRHSQPPNGGSRQTPAIRIAMAAPMQFQPLLAADDAFVSTTMKPSASQHHRIGEDGGRDEQPGRRLEARLPPADDRADHRAGREHDGAHDGSLHIERGAGCRADDQRGNDMAVDEGVDAPHLAAQFFRTAGLQPLMIMSAREVASERPSPRSGRAYTRSASRHDAVRCRRRSRH